MNILLQKISEGLNGLYPMLKEFELNWAHGNKSEHELINDLYFISYIATIGVIDKTRQYEGSELTEIFVPHISSDPITIEFALEVTVQRLIDIAQEMGQTEAFNEIVWKKDLFWQLDQEVPDYIKNQL